MKIWRGNCEFWCHVFSQKLSNKSLALMCTKVCENEWMNEFSCSFFSLLLLYHLLAISRFSALCSFSPVDVITPVSAHPKETKKQSKTNVLIHGMFSKGITAHWPRTFRDVHVQALWRWRRSTRMERWGCATVITPVFPLCNYIYIVVDDGSMYSKSSLLINKKLKKKPIDFPFFWAKKYVTWVQYALSEDLII